MNNEPIDQAVAYALKKKNLLDTSILQYVMRAILAGVFIGFAIMISFRVAEPFYDVHSPATYLLCGLFFGIALLLIMYGEAELFTGNTMAFTISTLQKKTTWKDTIANWGACYFGNMIGALIFAFMIMMTGLFELPEKSNFLIEVVNGKMHTPTIQLLFRAILCNWLVCLAIWIPMNVKGDMAKITSMMLLVFGFIVSGYEHSIANMVLFATSIAIPHPESINVMAAIHNLIPVTIGNIIGGGVFVGALYTFFWKTNKKEALKIEPSTIPFKTNERPVEIQ